MVLVLWVLVLLAILAVGLVVQTQLDDAVRIAAADKVKARWLGRAGINLAISELFKDDSKTDGPGDPWYDSRLTFRAIAMDYGVFTVYGSRFDPDGQTVYGAVDEASKLNVNVCDMEQLMKLPGMNQPLADAIVKWRQEKGHENGFSTLRQLGVVDFADREVLYGEDSDLDGLLGNNENDGEAQPPMDDQDGQLDRGVLAYLTVYSYELNQDGQGRARININTADALELEVALEIDPSYAKWIDFNRDYRQISDILDKQENEPGAPEANQEGGDPMKRPTFELFRRIADRITVDQEKVIPGRININTAGREVLMTLPGIQQKMVLAIIEHRRSLTEGFGSIAEVLTVPGMTLTQFKEFEPAITVRSNVFTLRSSGIARRTHLREDIEAVIDRGSGAPVVLYWKEN